MKRRYEAIKKFPGIYRILIQSDKGWREPSRGAKFAASRSEGNIANRRRAKRHFESFEEAKAFRVVDFAYQDLVRSRGQRTDDFLFQDLAKLYEEKILPNKFPSTQDRYRSYLKSHFQFFWDMPVENIDTVTIDAWIAWLKRPEYLATQNKTRCNYHHEFSLLRTMLNVYVSRINRNYRLPFIKEHRASLKVREKAYVKKDLSPGEFRNFMDALRDICVGTQWEFVYYIAWMQYRTFSRLQDVVALHFEDFDLQRMEVTINKKIIFARTKDRQTFLVAGSKADGGKVIPISSMLKALFLEWTMKCGVRSGPIFKVNGEWPTYRQIEHRYSMALAKAGLPYTATHILRHASLTEAQEATGDLNQTKLLAGHKSIKTTERYAKVRSHQIRETQDKIDRKLSETWDGTQMFANRQNGNEPFF